MSLQVFFSLTRSDPLRIVWFAALAFVLLSGCRARGTARQGGTSYFCPMHPEIVSERPGSCPICSMDLVAAATPGALADASASPTSPAKLESPHAPEPSSIQPPLAESQPQGFPESHSVVVPVVAAAIETVPTLLRVPATVQVDEQLLFSLQSRVAGWIVELPASIPGRAVRKGERLVTLDSPELWRAEAEWQLGVRTSKQWQEEGSPTLAQASEPLLEALRKRLGWLGVSSLRLEKLSAGAPPSGTLQLVAPFDGFLLEVSAKVGMWVERGTPLASLAQLDRVFLEANFFESDLPHLESGTRAEVHPPGGREPFSHLATLAFVEPKLESETRTVRARFLWKRQQGELFPGQWVTLLVRGPAAEPTVTVPEEAVLPTGRRFLVFVEDTRGRFTPREVLLGSRAQGRIAIRSGLSPGERVAARAAFLLDSESRIRGRLEADPHADPVHISTPHKAGEEPRP